MSEIINRNYRQEPISFWSEFECKHFGCRHHALEDFFKSQVKAFGLSFAISHNIMPFCLCLSTTSGKGQRNRTVF